MKAIFHAGLRSPDVGDTCIVNLLGKERSTRICPSRLELFDAGVQAVGHQVSVDEAVTHDRTSKGFTRRVVSLICSDHQAFLMWSYTWAPIVIMLGPIASTVYMAVEFRLSIINNT